MTREQTLTRTDSEFTFIETSLYDEILIFLGLLLDEMPYILEHFYLDTCFICYFLFLKGLRDYWFQVSYSFKNYLVPWINFHSFCTCVMVVNQSLKWHPFLGYLINTGFTFLGFSLSLSILSSIIIDTYHHTIYSQEKNTADCEVDCISVLSSLKLCITWLLSNLLFHG